VNTKSFFVDAQVKTHKDNLVVEGHSPVTAANKGKSFI